MNLSLTKKILVSLLGLGVVGSLVGMGTFASFTAQTTNPSNTFATGTLVLSNKVDSVSACLSTGAGTTTDTNINANCTTLVALTNKKPGDTATTANITIKNEGSLDASALKVFENAVCVTVNDPARPYNGTGDVCDSLNFYIQEYNSTFATPTSSCVYPVNASASCSFNSSNTVKTFRTSYNSSSTGLSLGSLTTGSSKYYQIAVQLDSGAGNAYQGRQATFDLTWYLAQ